MKNLKLRKILFGSVIAAMSLATVSLSIFAIKSSSNNVIEANASLSNDGYDTGEYKYYTGSYYDSIGDSAISSGGTTLISKLRALIQPSSAYGYAKVYTFNEAHDCYPSDYDGVDPLTGNTYPTTNNSTKRGRMWDMYSDDNWVSVTDRAGNYSTVGDVYNREHSMPKSWFGGSDSNQPGTDPNHLFNTDGKVNGVRSNYAYGEVTSVKTDCYTLNPSIKGFGKLGTNSSGVTVFEPDDAYKGDLARAQMYMATAYYNWNLTQGSGEATNCFTYSGGVSTMKDYYINLLTKWSEEDPVSQKEIDRNNAMQTASDGQGNRNPFIDHPGWANKIWGGTAYTWGKTSGEPTVNSVSVSPTSLNLNLAGTYTGQLTATVNVSGGAAQTVTWSSSNTSVATVSSSGLVTGKATGTATITVKSTVDTSKQATCTVTVVNSTTPTVNSVSVSPETLNLDLNGTTSGNLTATVDVSYGAAQTVSWSSSNTSVATVSSSGVVTANAVGTATITATSTADSSKKDTCSVTVIDSSITPSGSYTCTFESSSGFTAGSNYQGTVTGTDTSSGAIAINSTGIGWQTYYGNWSTNDAITNSQSAQMRLYSNGNLGYVCTTTSIDNITSFSFKAKTSNTNLKFDTAYSSNGSTWTNIDSGKSLTTTADTYNVAIPSSATANYIKIAVSSSSTKPSSSNYKFTVDDITINYGSSASTKTLVSIELNTSSVDKSFTVGDAFNYEGLVVTAYYSDSATGVVVTPTSVSSPDMSSAGTKTVTVTYTDSYGTASATYEITVSSGGSTDTYTYKLVTGSLSAGDEVYIAINVSGQYYVLGKDQIGTYAYYLTSTAVTVSDNKITPTSDMTLWTVGVSSSKYTFSYDSKYLNSNVSTSGTKTYYNIYYANSSSYSGYQWTYSSNQLKSNQNVYLSHKIYNSTPEFTGTDTAPSYSIYFFRKTVQYTADSWAQLFLDNVSCNVSGTSEPTLNMTWSELSDAYDNVVSTTEKNLLKNASFTVTGSGSSTVVTPDSGTTQVVANAISKYEIIVRKYSYTNFIGRSGLSGQAFFLTDSESTSMVVAIVITSLIAISTIGGFIFLKKKRENY